MTTLERKPGTMSAIEFLDWTAHQNAGRYELIAGDVVRMAAERVAHNQAKLRVAVNLLEAVRNAAAPCQVFTDGMAFVVDDEAVFEPDAMVRCGDPLDPDATMTSDPVIVVEVLSPSTASIDTSLKLLRYFSVASVAHYLIVSTSASTVIHHRRSEDGWATRIVGPGPLRLDPPGITLLLD